MSRTALHRHARASRHDCAGCGSRRALFQYRGAVRADRDHNLCFECYRSELDRQRAYRLHHDPDSRGRLGTAA
jgi:hypothetical protein